MTPATLEHFGLEESIKDLCRQYSPDLHIKMSVTGLKGRLDRYLEVSIYRMAQELLQNTVSHAKATSASVQVKKEKQSMILTVIDNGQGFLPEEVKTKGLGLASLFNRVRLLNGRVDVVNTKGTKVTIKIPLTKPL
jgi:signal transduction histidine kinase